MTTLIAIFAPSLFVLFGCGLVMLFIVGLQKMFHFPQFFVTIAIYILLTFVISSIFEIIVSQFSSTKVLATWGSTLLLLIGAFLTARFVFRERRRNIG